MVKIDKGQLIDHVEKILDVISTRAHMYLKKAEHEQAKKKPNASLVREYKIRVNELADTTEHMLKELKKNARKN